MRGRGLRWLIVIAVLAGGGLILSRLAFGAQNSAQTTSVIQDETLVEVGDLNVTVSATGVVAPARQVTLQFELSAPVKEVLVRAGQPVRAGEVLARLDVADLEASLESTRLALDLQQIAYDALSAPARDVDIAAAQATLDAAWAQVNAANASAPDATRQEIARLQTELARNRLWQQQLQLDDRLNPPDPPPGVPLNMIPVLPDDQRQQIESGLRQADYEVQIAAANQDGLAAQGPDIGSLSSASAQVVSAQAQLDRLLDGPSDIDLSMAELELERAQMALALAESNLNRAVLVAPFDGIAAQVNLTVGELPPSGVSGGAVELIDTSSYYIDLSVDETDVVAVATGQPAALAFDALPEARISGTVTRIAPTPTRVGQVVTYTTRVTLDPTLEPVRAGMNATATVIVEQLENVLLLRNRFIRIDRSTQEAFVTIQRPDGRFEEVQVELGLRNDTHSEIISGVTAGQRVVLLPRESLIPGFGGGR
jgi:HlyD family secretion protein